MLSPAVGAEGHLAAIHKAPTQYWQQLPRYQDAAETCLTLNMGNITQLLDKANHLAAIHKAPAQKENPREVSRGTRRN